MSFQYFGCIVDLALIKIIAVSIIFLLLGCKERATRSSGSLESTNTNTVAADAYSIFEQNCASCHKSDQNDSFNVLDFATLRKSQKLISVGDPAKSYLVDRIKNDMPPGEKRLSSNDIKKIEDWIRQGAQDAPAQDSLSDSDQEFVKKIRLTYQSQVEKILQYKCADCHSSAATIPSQGYMPGIGGLILDDIKRGQAAMNFGGGFPFAGSYTIGKMIGDVKMIGETIKKNTMPPTKYVVIHPLTRLSTDEKKIILKWTTDTLDAFEHRK
jgi:cytochrome c553